MIVAIAMVVQKMHSHRSQQICRQRSYDPTSSNSQHVHRSLQNACAVSAARVDAYITSDRTENVKWKSGLGAKILGNYAALAGA
jgi:hypothetical protein